MSMIFVKHYFVIKHVFLNNQDEVDRNQINQLASITFKMVAAGVQNNEIVLA